MSLQRTLNYIDKRLATIDTMPETWGSPESLELQTLLLIELAEVEFTIMPEPDAAFRVRFAFLHFIRSHVENASAEPLWLQLERLGRASELPSILGKFRDLMKRSRYNSL